MASVIESLPSGREAPRRQSAAFRTRTFPTPLA
jgi:hypothetical protein